MSGSLVSPGVKVSIIDESAYGASGPGTVPLIVIATAANKLAPGSTTNIAPGTLPQNAGDLYLITSQRDALQTFGNPTFYSAAGSAQYDNELNEIGLFTLYQYLGVANSAYVIRANVDLEQLVPNTSTPTGPTLNGTYWLDTQNSTWGIFQSNGNINPAYAWQSQKPIVISSDNKLCAVTQGNRNIGGPLTSSSVAAISYSGNLVINGVAVPLTAGQSLAGVVSAINANSQLKIQGITATIFTRTAKLTSNSVGDICNIRLTNSNCRVPFTFFSEGGSPSSMPTILDDLGFSRTDEPLTVIEPVMSLGISGNYAVNTLADEMGNYTNTVFQMITLATSQTTNTWWFPVGSGEIEYPGYSWIGAVPTVITGTSANPVFVTGHQFTISIDNASPITVTVGDTSLPGLVSTINTALASTNTIATITVNGASKYLTLTNYDATSVKLQDLTDQNGVGTTLALAGIPTTNTYWASVTGTASQPTFVAATLLTQSAGVIAPGSGYVVGDTLTVIGGTHSTATQLSVQSLEAVSLVPTGGASGTGYRVNDTITFGISDSNYTTTIVAVVEAINNGAIESVNIIQNGQYTGLTAPTSDVPVSATSGVGQNATFTIVWGVNTTNVAVAGNYTVYPVGTVSVSGGSGTGATFALTSGFLTSNSFSVTIPGQSPVTVHVPASLSPSINYATLAQLVQQINTVAFPSGPIVASTNSSNQLVITNTNGTAFSLADLSGTPLKTAGIATGTTFGRGMVYQGYAPTLTVPSSLSALKAENVWINTTPAGNGVNLVVKRYESGEWVSQNSTPNTGNIPLYTGDSAADTAFGALKAYGSIYGQYNYYDDMPVTANVLLNYWDGFQWMNLQYVSSISEPAGPPSDGTLWYNTELRADILVNTGTVWQCYGNLYPGTDPNGPILSSAIPLTQSTGSPLSDYDLWINTDMKPYPQISRYNASTASWIQIDNTDHASSAGIIFADARYTADGTTSGSQVPAAMNRTVGQSAPVLDPDAPDPLLYPPYMLLFNTRYSTYNVKKWTVSAFPQNLGTAYPTDTWVTFSGNAPNGVAYMGPAAQRAVVVAAMNSAFETNQDIRAQDNYYSLISAPGYPECIAQMVQLNVDINNVAFVIGDTPSTLVPTGTAIQNWATNAADVAENGPDGLITHSPYMGLWYPWGLTQDLQGTDVLVPPSLVALTTIAYNDSVAYPWFAPAGFTRGLVSVVSSVGYLDSSGYYVPVKLTQGQRDVLYANSINPIAYMPGRGLVVFGQKTLDPIATALDRVNVARLCAYLSWHLNQLAQPFLFEQNDTQTRTNVTAVFKGYLNGLVGLRALYDFSVICDSSNNTPVRIDANQLWIDIAIQPEKSIEFIYIPVRVMATGATLPKGG
jgi:hypothetical protein